MRRITRNAILVILATVGLLLALGALPSYLKSGDPYYVVATTAEPPAETVNVSNLSARRYEFTTGAVAAADNGTGRSEPYWRGPFGIKEGFTHSPFDEFDALTRDHPNATETVGNDSRIYVSDNGTAYRVVITQTPGAVGGGASGNGTSARLTGAEAAASAAPRAEVTG